MAQDAVTDIETEQMEVDGEPAVVITYTLNKVGSEAYFDVSVKATIDGRPVKVDATEGDVGTFIRRGSKERIVWNILKDVPDVDGELEVNVVAVPSSGGDDPNTDSDPVPVPVPILAGLGSVAGTGLGLVILGFTQESQASSDYDDYSNNRNPNSSFYTDMGVTRDELYTQANKKHKNAQLFMIGGGVVVVAAGAMLITRLVNNSKMASSQTKITPHIEVGTNFDYTHTQPTNSYGFKISHNF